MPSVKHPQHLRVKAARLLAGYKSAKALAEKLGPGLSDKTLRKIESETNSRVAEDHELEKIAAACGVDVRFFTADLADLGSVNGHTVIEVDAADLLNLVVTSLDADRDETLRRLQGRMHSLREEDAPGSPTPPAG